MHIKKIESRHRRDFIAMYECEYCGFVNQSSGYDDTNFHENVIPKMKCQKCGKTAEKYKPLTTKYPDYVII